MMIRLVLVILALLGPSQSWAERLADTLEAACDPMMFQETFELSSHAGEANLRETLKRTPRPRVRTEAPALLVKKVEFDQTILDSRHADVLVWHVSKCVQDTLMGKYGSQVYLAELLRGAEGQHILNELLEFQKRAGARAPATAERTGCYFQTGADRQAHCYQDIVKRGLASQTMATSVERLRSHLAHVSRVPRLTLAKASEQNLLKQRDDFRLEQSRAPEPETNGEAAAR